MKSKQKETPQLMLKAYEIDRDKLDEGYLSDTIVCHAENVNKAKKSLLELVRYDDWKLKKSGDYLDYLNIPVKRRPSSDKVLFEGNICLRCEIEEKLNERKRIEGLDEILNNPNILYCYIIKGSYYRPNYCGYTSIRSEAGVYPKSEAVEHAKSVREIRLERIDIDEHNLMIKDKIRDLEYRLISQD